MPLLWPSSGPRCVGEERHLSPRWPRISHALHTGPDEGPLQRWHALTWCSGSPDSASDRIASKVRTKPCRVPGRSSSS